jgi:hypothetical protein
VEQHPLRRGVGLLSVDADHPFGTAASSHGVVWKHCTMISALLEGTIHSENPSRQSVEAPENDLVGALLQTQKCP